MTRCSRTRGDSLTLAGFWGMSRGIVVMALLGCLPLAPASGSEKPLSDDDVTFFEQHIRPLLITHCYDCHSEDSGEMAGELLLDRREGWSKGGTGGPAIVPSHPEKSLLMRAVRYTDSELKMPPEDKLSATEIAHLEEWIRRGAKDPRDQPAPVSEEKSIDVEAGRAFWAFRSPEKRRVPAVAREDWPRTPIDHFLLAKMEAEDVVPAAPADRRDLIRRAYFDLVGLPPAPEEVDAFLADSSDEAFDRVIEDLLASPRYGERWGRHWLDVVRYADSNGLDENAGFAHAWRYRDYVIDSFNEDKPFDEFLIEQIAGDLLPYADDETRQRQLIATGFLSLGAKVLAEPDKTKLAMDIVDEQIRTLGRSVIGLTIGCARCHDHKFDPISTRDYYSLAGIFRSTQTMEHDINGVIISRWWEHGLAEGEERELIEELDARIAILHDKLANAEPKEIAALKAEVRRLNKLRDQTPSAMGVREGTIANVRVHRRGSHLTLGDEVPRGFPVVLTRSPVEVQEKSSGRLELARWLTAPDHPLTARVLANRLWRWHFGRGLVKTTDNFGKLGEVPSHPELLDWLAVRLIEEGWSIKQLHREIMRSRVYQMSSHASDETLRRDPDNRLYSRAPVQRLSAEQMRDSLLAVSGLLEPTMGGPACDMPNRDLVFNHTSMDMTDYADRRRSVYLPVIRNHVYDFFQQFDFPDPANVSGDRNTTTVAPQALLLMNSDEVSDSAEAFAERLIEEGPRPDAERVDRAYRIAFGRHATAEEIARSLRFLDRFREAMPQAASAEPRPVPKRAWVALGQVLLVSNEFVYVP
ncbi:Planctomycete cytochrome C [Planctomycetes bacterium Pan216]|uniref:Planctomycete cytochrome C n=1 Tax=Kolteria novifilia TaxID=2527975 RepID=A0A518B0B1_9BACT|nr:Planctomycete cytochrome C [Planctomycetes bacterium Pan216]